MKKIVLSFTCILLFSTCGPKKEMNYDGSPKAHSVAINTKTNLGQAIELYKVQNYLQASVSFYEARKEVKEGSETYFRLNQFIANSLFHLGFPHASIPYLTEIISKGRTSNRYPIAIRKLVLLSELFPSDEKILESLNSIKIEDFPFMLNDRLAILLAREALLKKDFTRAKALLNLIGEASPYAKEKIYYAGLVNYNEGNYKVAIESFKSLVEFHISDEEPYLADQTYLSLARVFYALGKYETAIEFYETIPHNSIFWPESLFELSWAYFLDGNYNRSLGLLDDLNSDFFVSHVLNESLVVMAIIYFDLCMIQEARLSVAAFHERYDPLIDKISRLDTTYQKNPKDFGLVLKEKKYDQLGSELLSELFYQNIEIENQSVLLKKLDRELEIFVDRPEYFKNSGLGSTVLENLESSIDTQIDKLGKKGLEDLAALNSRLKNLATQVDLVEFEVLNLEKKELNLSLSNKESESKIESNITKYGNIVDSELFPSHAYYSWPDEGEGWTDEIGHKVFFLAEGNLCQQQ